MFVKWRVHLCEQGVEIPKPITILSALHHTFVWKQRGWGGGTTLKLTQGFTQPRPLSSMQLRLITELRHYKPESENKSVFKLVE